MTSCLYPANEVGDYLEAQFARVVKGLIPFARIRRTDGRAVGCTAYGDPRYWPSRNDFAPSRDAFAHEVPRPPAHSASSIRVPAASSWASMCSEVSPRASDMETTALRRPSSVTPLRVM